MYTVMMQKNQADSNAAQTFDRQRSATPANFKRAVAGSVVTPDRQVDSARHPSRPTVPLTPDSPGQALLQIYSVGSLTNRIKLEELFFKYT
jgi:hypothetical protein